MHPLPLISLANITVRLRDRPYLHKTSWQMHSDEHWAILGPNGSGKTTFAKTLRGEIPVIEGSVRYHFSHRTAQNITVDANAIGYVSSELHRMIMEREIINEHSREFGGRIDEITSVKQILVGRIPDDKTPNCHQSDLRAGSAGGQIKLHYPCSENGARSFAADRFSTA